VFSGLAADSCCYNVVYGGQPARSAATTPTSALLSARLVSENYFEVLGINAVLGRTFLPDEGQSEKSNPVRHLSKVATCRPLGCSLPIDTLYVDQYYSYRRTIGDMS
jgi:hypothetical protein